MPEFLHKIHAIEDSDGVTQEIVPLGLQSNNHTATLPTLSADATIALSSDIPTVNNGPLTIQQNGTTLATFSANQTAAVTVNLADTGATSVTFSGAGNVVSTATYAAESRTLTLTKGVTALTSVKKLVTTASVGLSPGTETLASVGTINLHRISKTGSFFDLVDSPWEQEKDSDGYYLVSTVHNAQVGGYLQINDDSNAPVSRPSNVIAFVDPDVYIYGTGITIQDTDDEALVQLSYPSHSGTIATEDQIGLDLLDLRYAT